MSRDTEEWEEGITCSWCLNFMRRVQKCAFTSFLDVDKGFDEWKRHQKTTACSMRIINRTHKGNGAPSGAFAFTITKSPTDPISISDMLTAVRKVMGQKSCKVKKYAWYYEDKGKDEEGNPIHPHIHGMYETETSGRIEAKHWKRAYAIWDEKQRCGAGHRGGYHRPVKDDESYMDYIAKDGGMSESYGLNSPADVE